MEIILNDKIINAKDVTVTDFRNETLNKRESIFGPIDFTCIKLLKGNELILSLSFDAIKKEELDN